MFFLKKFMLCTGALFLIFLGGAGTQSTNALMQGGGMLGLVIGLIILYIFSKMAWRAMGCLPSLFAITAIVVFILYAIGGFNGGIDNVIPNLKSFIGFNSASNPSDSGPKEQSGIINLLQEEAEEPISESFSDGEFDEETPKTEEKKGFLEMLFGGSSSKDKEQQPQEVYSVVYSSAGVISGDTLSIKGRKFRLFGIDAPEINQNCADSTGRAYNCGQQAISWLSSWLQDHPLQCRVMERDAKGNMIGTCSLGPYDIGAALVNAGWAVAYTKHSNVYLPYQEQAQKNLRGLWQGEFYMPWDWRKIQARKPKVKIIHKKSGRKKTFGLFD